MDVLRSLIQEKRGPANNPLWAPVAILDFLVQYLAYPYLQAQ